MTASDRSTGRFRFRRHQRLGGKASFDRVFAQGVRGSAGPLSVVVAANGCGRHRLGLGVGRRVGNAVQRHRVKRCLREAFRLGIAPEAADAASYDLVVVVRPHPIERFKTADYRRLLERALWKAIQRLGTSPRDELDRL